MAWICCWSILVAHVYARAFLRRGEAPERRHLGAGTELLRIFQPNRNPLFAELDANILKVWSDFLLILHQILRLQVQSDRPARRADCL